MPPETHVTAEEKNPKVVESTSVLKIFTNTNNKIKIFNLTKLTAAVNAFKYFPKFTIFINLRISAIKVTTLISMIAYKRIIIIKTKLKNCS